MGRPMSVPEQYSLSDISNDTVQRDKTISGNIETNIDNDYSAKFNSTGYAVGGPKTPRTSTPKPNKDNSNPPGSGARPKTGRQGEMTLGEKAVLTENHRQNQAERSAAADNISGRTKRQHGDALLAGGAYMAGQAIHGAFTMGGMIAASNKKLEGTIHTNKTTLLNTQLKYHNLKDFTSMKMNAYQQAGLPSYMAYGGGAPTTRVTQTSGANSVTSKIPGDPTTSAYIGSSSQQAAGWGNQM